MLDNTGTGGKTNNVRQYRGRGKDKQLSTIQGGKRGRVKEGEGKYKQC